MLDCAPPCSRQAERDLAFAVEDPAVEHADLRLVVALTLHLRGCAAQGLRFMGWCLRVRGWVDLRLVVPLTLHLRDGGWGLGFGD